MHCKSARVPYEHQVLTADTAAASGTLQHNLDTVVVMVLLLLLRSSMLLLLLAIDSVCMTVIHACTDTSTVPYCVAHGRGVFFLLFLLAYDFTVPITFLTWRSPQCSTNRRCHWATLIEGHCKVMHDSFVAVKEFKGSPSNCCCAEQCLQLRAVCCCHLA
jgi:hypothetical protein